MKKLIIPVIAALLASAISALAATVFVTSIGDLTFPFQPQTCLATGASPQTCNGGFGKVTTGTLTTAAATSASFTINNANVTATNALICTINAYSGTFSTNGDPVIEGCVPGAGTITVNFRNVNAANALNGALTFGFQVN
jgi:type 1 fimbria pilin